jgi:hypothetical protein
LYRRERQPHDSQHNHAEHGYRLDAELHPVGLLRVESQSTI